MREDEAMSEAMYCGNAQEKAMKSGDKIIEVDLDLDQLGGHLRGDAKEFIRTWTGRDGVTHKTIKLSVMPLRAPTEYRTHCVKINTFKPDPSRRSGGGEGGEPKKDEDPCPF
jgi:hypothetical protein